MNFWPFKRKEKIIFVQAPGPSRELMVGAIVAAYFIGVAIGIWAQKNSI